MKSSKILEPEKNQMRTRKTCARMSLGLNEKRGKKIANKIGNQPDCFITDVTMVYIIAYVLCR